MPLVSPGAVYVARPGYHDNAIGSAESDMGGWATAAAAWNAALAIFDPTLAAQIAEAETGAKGAVTPERPPPCSVPRPPPRPPPKLACASPPARRSTHPDCLVPRDQVGPVKRNPLPP
jgi:hypothetical protein